jgi:hypothetical protein
LAGATQDRRHPDAAVLRDLAVMLADGGDCLSDLAVLRDQPALFGPVASTATAWRVVERTASDPDGLVRLQAARAHAQCVAPTLDVLGCRLLLDWSALAAGISRRPASTREMVASVRDVIPRRRGVSWVVAPAWAGPGSDGRIWVTPARQPMSWP